MRCHALEQNREKELALITLVVLSLEMSYKPRIQGWSAGYVGN